LSSTEGEPENPDPLGTGAAHEAAPPRREEVHSMGTLTDLRRSLTPEDVADTIALWDRMRAAAISEADRQEIDEIFSRQVP
jgi:hypothetical protein